MKHIKTHKINPVYLRPGDTINLHYAYEEPEGVYNERWLNLDSVDEPMTIDTVTVYKTEAGEYGLKSGRALILGEDDGTYKDLPITSGHQPLIGGRKQ